MKAATDCFFFPGRWVKFVISLKKKLLSSSFSKLKRRNALRLIENANLRFFRAWRQAMFHEGNSDSDESISDQSKEGHDVRGELRLTTETGDLALDVHIM